MNPNREEVLFALALALEELVEQCTAFQSARGLAHSKTWRTSLRPCHSRSDLECGGPLPPFAGDGARVRPQNPKGIPSSSPGLPSPRGYPGMRVVIRHNPNGVASILAPRTATTPLGLPEIPIRFPR